MLQSIQYGIGPPTYIYSNKAATFGNGFFHVYASQMSGHDPRRENPNVREVEKKRGKSKKEREEFLCECYEKEFKENNLIRWKQEK